MILATSNCNRGVPQIYVLPYVHLENCQCHERECEFSVTAKLALCKLPLIPKVSRSLVVGKRDKQIIPLIHLFYVLRWFN